jgi:hypothetical protein
MTDWPRVGRSRTSFEILIGSSADDTDCSRRGEQEFAESIVYYESKERDWGGGFGMKSWMPWTESYAIPSCPG